MRNDNVFIVKSDNENDFLLILDIIHQHRGQAVKAVNSESLLTAWEVGKYLSEKIESCQWGSEVVKQLSEYIIRHDASLRGWSRRTLYKMVQFYEVYSNQLFTNLLNTLNVGTVQKQLANNYDSRDITFVPTTLAQMPEVLTKIGWASHQIILNRCEQNEQRLFYILYADYERLKCRELERAIVSDVYSRVLKDKKYQSEMLKKTYPSASVLLKDKTFLDILGLPVRYKEPRLRKAIVEHMKAFILELGKDFLFVDQEYPVKVGNETFKIDLLFYNRSLQCLVAIELKTTKFHPKDLGQLEFYMEALDQDVRRTNENPTIGILMCRDADPEVVRYALNRSVSPTMVSMYEEELKIGSVLQRSLAEFCEFVTKQTKIKKRYEKRKFIESI